MTWRCFLCDATGLGGMTNFQNHLTDNHHTSNPALLPWTPEPTTYASDQQDTLDLTPISGSHG